MDMVSFSNRLTSAFTLREESLIGDFVLVALAFWPVGSAIGAGGGTGLVDDFGVLLREGGLASGCSGSSAVLSASLVGGEEVR